MGPHPETGAPITAGIGRFGPYVQHQGTYRSLGADDDVLAVGLNRAVALLAEAAARSGARALGRHPETGEPVTVRKGRFGAYVARGALKAPVPKGRPLEEVTLEEALALLAARAERDKAAKGKGAKGAKRARAGGRKAPRRAGAKAAPRRRKGAKAADAPAPGPAGAE